MTAYTIKANEQYKSNEVYFNSKPEQATIDALKALKMRWNNTKKCWYGFADSDAINAALNGEEITPAQAVKAGSVIASLWERCDVSTIPEHCRTLDTKTIAKECREHLKKQFPECSFSVRIGSGGWASCNEIIAYITASPYERPEKIYSSRHSYNDMKRSECEPLQAILDYCQAWLQSYNYDNSDSMTDYFDVNFYGDFAISYDYKQTEQTAETLETLKQYATARQEERTREEEAERAAFAAYQAEQEEARKRAELYRIECERKTAAINAAVVVVDLSNDEKFRLEGLRGGSGKEATIDELRETISDRPGMKTETAEITRKVFLDPTTYGYFTEMFLHDFDFLAGKGGTATDDSRVNDENIYQLTAEQRETVFFYLSDCVAIYEGDILRLVIDPEGYNYARYVYIVTEDTKPAAHEDETPKKEFYFPKPVKEQAENIKRGDVVTLLTLNPWTLTVEHITCFVESVKIANYAQYKDALYLTYRTGKNGAKLNSMWIHDNTNAVIFSGVLPDVPAELKRTKISNNLYALNYAGNGARDYIITAAEYYKSIGYSVLLDTIQR